MSDEQVAHGRFQGTAASKEGIGPKACPHCAGKRCKTQWLSAKEPGRAQKNQRDGHSRDETLHVMGEGHLTPRCESGHDDRGTECNYG